MGSNQQSPVVNKAPLHFPPGAFAGHMHLELPAAAPTAVILRLESRNGGVPKIKGTFLGGPQNKDFSILGCI